MTGAKEIFQEQREYEFLNDEQSHQEYIEFEAIHEEPKVFELPAIPGGMTKTEINHKAFEAVSALLESGDVLTVAEQLAAMETFIKEVKADTRYTNYVREEVGKYGKVYTTPSGAKIEQVETGTKYDYSKCNDQHLNQMLDSLKELEECIDKRKQFLKTVPANGLIVTEEFTGETWTCFPPSKTSTSSFKISLAK